jgi:ferric-dicitrate binding protein FerR (iron transport regulator)
MTNGLLESIIHLEKRIQLEVAAEQARADAWQRRELTAIESAFTAALKTEEARGRQMLTEKKAELQNKGAALEAASSAWCQCLLNLDDETLHEVLRRHLAAILPGGDHDHPHGQS